MDPGTARLARTGRQGPFHTADAGGRCGFTRNNLPGKAHTDYWADEAVFGHFFEKGVFASPLPAAAAANAGPPAEKFARPAPRPPAQGFRRVAPYLLALAALFPRVYFLL